MTQLNSPVTRSGTFTPVLSGGTVIGVGTYTLQQGFYLKTGRLVCANFRISWTAHTGTGQAYIAMPFVSTATGNAYWSGSAYGGPGFSLQGPGDANLYFYTSGTATYTVPATGDLIGSITYWTDSSI